jgi:hypothetical protein
VVENNFECICCFTGRKNSNNFVTEILGICPLINPKIFSFIFGQGAEIFNSNIVCWMDVTRTNAIIMGSCDEICDAVNVVINIVAGHKVFYRID